MTEPAQQPIAGPRVWHGPDMTAREAEWTHTLSPAEIAELDVAIERVLAEDRDVVAIRRVDFPLPQLGRSLRRMRDQLLEGPGFALVRGVPVARYDMRRAAIAFFGIGAHLGEAVSQNARGHALGHVCDLGFDIGRPLTRGYQTAEGLRFHTDATDFVALLCLRTAKTGGLSRIVSAAAIYNAMLARRPDLVRVLTQPVYRDRRGEIPEGCKPWYRMPVFNLYRGRLLTSYVRSTARKAQRFADVPRLTDAQNAAFDMLDALAADPALHLDITFRPGDVQVLTNHYVLHSRTAYEDHAAPERRRHLLRLWLACPQGPPLPAPFAEFQGTTASGRPNGYQMAGVALNAPLEPVDGGPGDTALRLAAQSA